MKKLLVVLFIPVLILSLSACSSFNNSEMGEGTGELQMLLTDAPADDVDELNITIEKIETHSDERGWEVFWESGENTEPKNFDLLSLQGVTDILGESELPVGIYTQIRLYLSDDANVVKDGDTYDVTIPSEAQTGLKLVNEFQIEEDVVKALLLDFDARKSLIDQTEAGSSTFDYKLKPTIRVIDRVISGDVSGSITNSSYDPSTYVVEIYEDISDSEAITSTNVKEDDSFKILGLEEGEYTLVIIDKEENQVYEEDITINAQEETELGEIDLSASE